MDAWQHVQDRIVLSQKGKRDLVRRAPKKSYVLTSTQEGYEAQCLILYRGAARKIEEGDFLFYRLRGEDHAICFLPKGKKRREQGCCLSAAGSTLKFAGRRRGAKERIVSSINRHQLKTLLGQ